MVWSGAITHTSNPAHSICLCPEGFKVAGAHLSRRVPISDTTQQSCTASLNLDLSEANGSSRLAVMVFSAGLLMAGRWSSCFLHAKDEFIFSLLHVQKTSTYLHKNPSNTLQIDISRKTLAANQQCRHKSQTSMHFRQQRLCWWGMRAAASPLLPSAS